MVEQELHKILQGRESETLELKSNIPSPEEIAHILAAMSNTQGGTLIVGIKEPDQAVGVNIHRTEAMLEASRRFTVPPIDIRTEVLTMDGHPVVVVSVPKSDRLVSASGGYYRRIGDRSRPLTAEEIQERVGLKDDTGAYKELALAVSAQTQTIDQLRAAFESANSIWKKIAIAAVSAIAGAVAKHLFDMYW